MFQHLCKFVYYKIYSTLFCGIFGSIVLENYGWRYTFQMVGILSLSWVYFLRTQMNKQTIDQKEREKDMLIKEGQHVQGSVPWKEIMTKPSFWSLIVAHVCQNNAYYILLTWLPTYFQENYPGSKVKRNRHSFEES